MGARRSELVGLALRAVRRKESDPEVHRVPRLRCAPLGLTACCVELSRVGVDDDDDAAVWALTLDLELFFG